MSALSLCQFRLSPKFKALRVRKLYEKDKEVTRRWQERSHKDPKDRPWVVQPTTGITLGTFLYFYLVGVLGKLVTTATVLLAGSGAVLRSGNDFDLVLNSVAAIFILDIDAFGYKFFVPNALKRVMIQTLPPFGLQQSRVSKLHKGLVHIYFYPMFAATAVMTWALWQGYWCTSYAPGTPFTQYYNVTAIRSAISSG